MTKGCLAHDGQIHGGEAEELRAGLEILLEDDELSRRTVQDLLDRVDARDSVAQIEVDPERWRKRALGFERQLVAVRRVIGDLGGGWAVHARLAGAQPHRNDADRLVGRLGAALERIETACTTASPAKAERP